MNNSIMHLGVPLPLRYGSGFSRCMAACFNPSRGQYAWLCMPALLFIFDIALKL
jgi:hypothetical protein